MPTAEVLREFSLARAKEVKRVFERRGFEVFVASSVAESREVVERIVPEDALVAWGGSMTLEESGIKDLLRTGPYRVLDRDRAASAEEVERIYRETFSCDYFFMSANALSLDGHIVNIDGRGNRLAALLFGPRYVVMVVGWNKVVATLDEALARAKHLAAPLNATRLEKHTPCRRSTVCEDCLGDESICSHTVITRRSVPRGRIKLILVGQRLGF
ncbi:lactate utilization protein [Spirochaeta thermophila]|uniref:LUD domain-containing protein n=1 Tax=Winmispira thermophila (strain ATCC 49972 / DSM 6192 / RI 19.B1) TaxID=665571 RepID=E0RNS8_WINT6|nr:lactate utilization protein [Spirochaeta thermophila]ADN01201.1 hypothetical protein STHERM_c02270 [Spirochaeta thermophila DSM 6192]